MHVLLTMLLTSSAAYAAPTTKCVDGAIVDLNVTSAVALSTSSTNVTVMLRGTAKDVTTSELDATSLLPTAPPVFSAGPFLAARGLDRAALEPGGYLLVQHASDVDAELGHAQHCYLTYNVVAVEVVVAEERLATAKKRQAEQAFKTCDPDQSGQHAVKAPKPAGQLRIPTDQARGGEGQFDIHIETPDYEEVGDLTILVAGGKIVSANSTTPQLFCNTQSLAELCVDLEAVFTLTHDKPFEVSTEVDWNPMTLNKCTVSR